jgi:hypothetical protein
MKRTVATDQHNTTNTKNVKIRYARVSKPIHQTILQLAYANEYSTLFTVFSQNMTTTTYILIRTILRSSDVT